MRAIVIFTLSIAAGLHLDRRELFGCNVLQDEPKVDVPAAAEQTAAAEATRTRLLKVNVSVAFTEARLGDILKEFAAQVDRKNDEPIMWTYGKDFPHARKVTYACKDKPVEEALDELFKKLGTLGYVVISKEGDRRDGWVLLTTDGERGWEKGTLPPRKLTAEEEADSLDKLKLAKGLIEDGKNDRATNVLRFILKQYPGSKAAREAKELLNKLEK